MDITNLPGSEGCSDCKNLLGHLARFFDMLDSARQYHTADWRTVDDVAKEMNI